jgi:outer membrane immunogenic protein
MTKIVTTVVTAALLAAGGSSLAAAADLPSSGRAAYYAPPVFTWTGLYIGANAGVGVGSFTQMGNSYFGNTSGGMFGATVGYNYQISQAVIGLEGDLGFGSINGNGQAFPGINGSAAINGLGTVRARAGFAFDRALLYLTGGYAGAWMKASVSDSVQIPNLYASQSNYLNGYAAGFGMEYAFTDHISVKGEYLYNSLNSQNFFGGTKDSLNSGVHFSTVRAGINYRF